MRGRHARHARHEQHLCGIILLHFEYFEGPRYKLHVPATTLTSNVFWNNGTKSPILEGYSFSWTCYKSTLRSNEVAAINDRLKTGFAPMIQAETSNERPCFINSESKCKSNTLAKRRGNRGNNRAMGSMVWTKAWTMHNNKTMGLFIWRRVVPSRRVTLHTEPPQAIELFIHFFINSSEPFIWESAKLACGTGWPLVEGHSL